MDKINNNLSPINMPLGEVDNKKPMLYSPSQVDMRELYTQEELDGIVAKFSCLHPTSPSGKIKCQFDMIYLPYANQDHVIINNRNMTNDTVEIYSNGSARSVGSWHNVRLEGDYSDIIKDVKARYEAKNAKGDAKVAADLDAMAELGKSQVKQ